MKKVARTLYYGDCAGSPFLEDEPSEPASPETDAEVEAAIARSQARRAPMIKECEDQLEVIRKMNEEHWKELGEELSKVKRERDENLAKRDELARDFKKQKTKYEKKWGPKSPPRVGSGVVGFSPIGTSSDSDNNESGKNDNSSGSVQVVNSSENDNSSESDSSSSESSDDEFSKSTDVRLLWGVPEIPKYDPPGGHRLSTAGRVARLVSENKRDAPLKLFNNHTNELEMVRAPVSACMTHPAFGHSAFLGKTDSGEAANRRAESWCHRKRIRRPVR